VPELSFDRFGLLGGRVQDSPFVQLPLVNIASIYHNHHASHQTHRARSHQLSNSSLAAGCHPAHCATLVYVLSFPTRRTSRLRLPSPRTPFQFQLTNRGRRRTKYSRMDWQYASRLPGIPGSSRCQRPGKFSSVLKANSLHCPSSVPFSTIVVGLRHAIDRDIPSSFFFSPPLLQAIL